MSNKTSFILYLVVAVLQSITLILELNAGEALSAVVLTAVALALNLACMVIYWVRLRKAKNRESSPSGKR